MTPEQEFIRWFADKQFMVVKKHRPEVRAHMVKALQRALIASARDRDATLAKTAQPAEGEASQPGPERSEGIAQ